MLHRDYLMRLVEELSKSFSEIAFLKQDKKYDDAISEIRKTGKTLVGLDLNMLNYISDADFAGNYLNLMTRLMQEDF